MSSEQSELGDHLDLAGREEEPERYDCRVTYRNMELEAEDGETAEFRCNSWDCYCCAHRMRMNLIEELEDLVERRPEMRRLLTVTVDEKAPASTSERHEYLTDRWNALRTELRDRYPGLSFVWIRHEGDEKGRPHLHLLVDRYLPHGSLTALTERVGLGPVVDIRRVDARNAAHYLTSYLGKGALASLPKGLRRYGSSEDISLDVRGSSDGSREWVLLMDDYQITDEDGDPLRRGVVPADFYIQKVRGGPVGLDPPD